MYAAENIDCVKSVQILSLWENTDQKNIRIWTFFTTSDFFMFSGSYKKGALT